MKTFKEFSQQLFESEYKLPDDLKSKSLEDLHAEYKTVSDLYHDKSNPDYGKVKHIAKYRPAMDALQAAMSTKPEAEHQAYINKTSPKYKPTDTAKSIQQDYYSSNPNAQRNTGD